MEFIPRGDRPARVPELAPDGFSGVAKLSYLLFGADFSAAFCCFAAFFAAFFWALASAFSAFDCVVAGLAVVVATAGAATTASAAALAMSRRFMTMFTIPV